MAAKYPYVSGSGGLVQATNHFRKSFPPEVTAATLKKLGIASNNESFVINILRFINLLDEKGQKTSDANSVFSQHNDEEFQLGLAKLIENAYDDLFLLYGDSTWDLPSDKLISFFRNTDKTSAVVGQRQASAFQALAGLSGHGMTPTQKATVTSRRAEKKSPAKIKSVDARQKKDGDSQVADTKVKSGKDMGLTVRIEINLPAVADQATYDRIFRSIRANLLNEE